MVKKNDNNNWRQCITWVICYHITTAFVRWQILRAKFLPCKLYRNHHYSERMVKIWKCAARFENKLTRELMVCEGDTLINVQFLRKYSAGVDSVCCSKNRAYNVCESFGFLNVRVSVQFSFIVWALCAPINGPACIIRSLQFHGLCRIWFSSV